MLTNSDSSQNGPKMFFRCTIITLANQNHRRQSVICNKPVVDVARDAQCCVHTRDSSCRGQTDGHTDGRMDGQTLCDNKGKLSLRVASQ